MIKLLIKLLYNILKIDNYHFAIYHLYYKEKIKITLIKSAYKSFFLNII